MKTINAQAIREEIQKYDENTEVYIGVDSQRYKKRGKWYAKYVKVVVVHKDGKHGGSLYKDVVDLEDFGGTDPTTRLLQEVQFINELWSEIKSVIEPEKLHIHIDVNSKPTEKSHSVMKQAIGWVYGVTGIMPDVKPNAWCATHAADEYCR